MMIIIIICGILLSGALPVSRHAAISIMGLSPGHLNECHAFKVPCTYHTIAQDSNQLHIKPSLICETASSCPEAHGTCTLTNVTNWTSICHCLEAPTLSTLSPSAGQHCHSP